MKLLFTGTISWLLIGLLFTFLTALTVLAYRRQRVPQPWAVLLPGCRIMALIILTAALLQPVLARLEIRERPGRLPVLIDNSGSMSVIDHYDPALEVALAASLGLYPSAARTNVFTTIQPRVEEIQRHSLELTGAIIQASADISSESVQAAARRRLRHLARRVRRLANDARAVREQIAGELRAYHYLAAAAAGAARPEQASFMEALVRFQDEVAGAAEVLAKLAQDLEPERGASGVAPGRAVTKASSRCALFHEAWRDKPQQLEALQRLADRVLAVSAIPQVEAGLTAFRGMTRLDIVRRLLREGPLAVEELSKFGEVELFTLTEPLQALRRLSDAEEGMKTVLPATRIGTVLSALGSYYGQMPMACVILLSDGNNNSGKHLREAREFLQERGIPIFSVGIGQTIPPPDVAIREVTAPETVFKGDIVRIRVTVQRFGFTDQPIQLRLSSGGFVVQEVMVSPGPSPLVEVILPVTEELEGVRHYEVEAVALAGEALVINNHKTVSFHVLSDPIKVLLLDELPRWESRHASIMLKKDSRVRMTTLFAGAVPGPGLPVGEEAFPESRSQLFEYRMIILGDINPGRFSSEQLAWLKAFVLERGGALVLLAGENHMPSAYLHTVLAELVPLRLQPLSSRENGTVESDAGAGRAGGVALELTAAGRSETAVQLGRSPEESMRHWREAEKMSWVRTAIQPRVHADILVTAADNAATPAIVSARAGLGNVIYLGTDSFWRWRRHEGSELHHRLWGQLVLWSTPGQAAGQGEYVRLSTDRAEYSPGETVVVTARVLGLDQRPLDDGVVSVTVHDQGGRQVRSLRLMPLPESGGHYRVGIRDLPQGKYTLVPRVLELGNAVLTSKYGFEVRDLTTTEYVHLGLDEAALRQLSAGYWYFSDMTGLTERIPAVSITHTVRRDVELWDSLHLILVVALLLGFEWQMRKRVNLV